jgi:hypothetical protein
MRAAWEKANKDKPLYAPQAAEQLKEVFNALIVAAQKYEALPETLHGLIDSKIEQAVLTESVPNDPLADVPLLISVPRAHREIVVSLLYSGRFPLVLKVVARASVFAAMGLGQQGGLFPLTGSPLYMPVGRSPSLFGDVS